MAWKGVITNAGAALLDQWALGGTLAITSAATGTGTVSESDLIAQTSLVSGKQTASIISSEKLTAGIKLKLQITAPQTSYRLQQYGVWASLSGGAATMLALFQNTDGIVIPPSTEAPDFVYTLFALMKISNTGELEVTVDTSALVSQGTLDEAMATKVDKVSGKGLSTNDYTTEEKTKLAGIEAEANKYIHPSYTARTGKPTANASPGFGGTVTVSQITTDVTGHVTAATDRTITFPSAAATDSAAGLMSAADKTKLDGVATGAEVNQNAFTNVKVGTTTIAADSKTDTLEIVAGDNITLTPSATNDALTIKATNTTYSSKTAASGGTAVSLVTTGEKYTWNSKANGSHTHAAGDINSGILAVARGGTGNGTGYIQIGQKSGTTLGSKATAEGNNTTASGNYGCHAEGSYTVASGASSHAEGSNTTASGDEAHAEGLGTVGSGEKSHAEGDHTTASGKCSHTEGGYTTASGNYSHVEGYNTIAAGLYQHVFGMYNTSNTTDIEIVGYGTPSRTKNIRTLDTNGNMTIAGTLTQSSDAKLKDVEGEIPDVSGIRAVRFKWNDTNGEHDDRDHIGYLAQDVEEIAPFLVRDDSNGYKSLDYIALLCAKMEWLERRVAELERR